MKIKKKLLGIGAVISSMGAFFAFQKLVLNDFPSKENLATIYFLYAATLLAAFHAATFWLRLELIETRGRGLHKNTPRYIDYSITALIAVGLFQIYFSHDSIAKYISKVSGGKQEILSNIQSAAQKHLDSDCKPDTGILVKVCEFVGMENCKQKKNFTAEFCSKTAEIPGQADLGKYVTETLSRDRKYLDHPIEYAMYQGGAQPIYSPIRTLVNQFVASSEYSIAPNDTDSRFALNWVTLILLPIVISLRALKTSVEIFGQLS